MEENMSAQHGWVDTMKQELSVDSLAGRMHMTREKLIDISLAGGIGFLFGFFLKKYSAFFALLVLVAVAVGFLHQYGVINVAIDWARAQEVLGIQPIEFNGGIVSFALEWIKANVAISISSGIGFLIGLRIG